MPTGPFAALGKWPVREHDGGAPRAGASSHVVVVKATRAWIKYTRKDAARAPSRVHHGRIVRWDADTVRVSVGGFQHIAAKRRA